MEQVQHIAILCLTHRCNLDCVYCFELKPFYSRISLNSKVISQALSYCQKSGVKSSKGFHEMLDEIDRYSHVINQEFNTLKRLDKSGKLTTQQLIRLYDLKLMFKEKEAVLTEKAVEDLIGSISRTAYTESNKLPLKGFVHILLRHTIQSTTKSSFTIPRTNVFKEIIKTISDEKNFVALKDGTLKTYVKKSFILILKGFNKTSLIKALKSNFSCI